MTLDEPSREGLESILRWSFGVGATLDTTGFARVRAFIAVLDVLPLEGVEASERAHVRKVVLERVFGEGAN
jgi:hypothetical protein